MPGPNVNPREMGPSKKAWLCVSGMRIWDSQICLRATTRLARLRSAWPWKLNSSLSVSHHFRDVIGGRRGNCQAPRYKQTSMQVEFARRTTCAAAYALHKCSSVRRHCLFGHEGSLACSPIGGSVTMSTNAESTGGKSINPSALAPAKVETADAFLTVLGAEAGRVQDDCTSVRKAGTRGRGWVRVFNSVAVLKKKSRRRLNRGMRPQRELKVPSSPADHSVHGGGGGSHRYHWLRLHLHHQGGYSSGGPRPHREGVISIMGGHQRQNIGLRRLILRLELNVQHRQEWTGRDRIHNLPGTLGRSRSSGRLLLLDHEIPHLPQLNLHQDNCSLLRRFVMPPLHFWGRLRRGRRA